MGVGAIPGLEHLPYAEVWFHELDEHRFAEASAAARAIDKTGLEVWTTTATPAVVEFLAARGYEEVRRYVISELDVHGVPHPGPPSYPLVTYAERPDLAPALFELACTAYADQPGRSETVIDEGWFRWGLAAHPPEAYFIALAGDHLLGYGYLEHEGEQWRNGFLAVGRDARGRGVAGAIKRAEVIWAKRREIATLRTATERRLTTMLELNRRLGYRELYEEIVLRGPAA